MGRKRSRSASRDRKRDKDRDRGREKDRDRGRDKKEKDRSKRDDDRSRERDRERDRSKRDDDRSRERGASSRGGGDYGMERASSSRSGSARGGGGGPHDVDPRLGGKGGGGGGWVVLDSHQGGAGWQNNAGYGGGGAASSSYPLYDQYAKGKGKKDGGKGFQQSSWSMLYPPEEEDDGKHKVDVDKYMKVTPHGPNVKQARVKMFEEELKYTNEENPFGDSKLTEKFVWGKKHDEDVQKGLVKEHLTKEEQINRNAEKIAEIHRVRARRAQRDEERAELDRQREEADRERAMEENRDWRLKEDQFQYNQTLLKAEIRIAQNREGLLDVVAKTLKLVFDDDPAGAATKKQGEVGSSTRIAETLTPQTGIIVLATEEDPMTRMQNAPIKELLELSNELEELEDPRHKESYWDGFGLVLEDIIVKKQSGGLGGAAAASGFGNTDADAKIQKDLDELLEGQDLQELEATKEELEAQLEEPDCVDTQFFKAVIEKIPLYRAKQQLKQVHEDAVRMAKESGFPVRENEGGPLGGAKVGRVDEAALARAKKKRKEAEELAEELAHKRKMKEKEVAAEREAERKRNLQKQAAGSTIAAPANINELPVPEDFLEDEEGAFSPKPQKSLDDLIHTFITDSFQKLQLVPLQERKDYVIIKAEEDEKNRMRNMQQLVIRFGGVADEKGDEWVEEQRKKNLGASGDGEEGGGADSQFNTGKDVVVKLEKKSYEWEAKYRARKPRYFNRVKTGFSWNKYNSTHYDSDVPPPKMVQGYRFNIFYPDLIDKRETPKYYLEKSDTNDTVILRFSAGPPYEDIAFKIVNREWNIQGHKGFRSVFDRGVLQLYFNFKTFIYRR